MILLKEMMKFFCILDVGERIGQIIKRLLFLPHQEFLL
jgi:hypothetical protein